MSHVKKFTNSTDDGKQRAPFPKYFLVKLFYSYSD